ncbi:hypothetical protein [Pseudomonas huanghezhanensis]|uniref:hypothetical protein n=1 Tax=Pseudomonas huanghezhanensis TaxID=3002903 RepID=UPI0022854033|nr:hypothetical protein [Pseudomonas sp. BSw22131]
MKRYILTAITCAALSVCAAQAEALQPTLNTPGPMSSSPGTPGTATPTPYPQVSAPGIPHDSSVDSPQLLPKIPQPGPPKDEALPGLDDTAIPSVKP